MRTRGTTSIATADISALDRHSLGAQARRELESLSRERDPELFLQGLIEFANREVERHQPATAALAYQLVAENGGAFPELSAKARRRWEGLQGVGGVGPRAEALLRELSRQTFDPAMILGMAGAGLAYRAARAASLTSLAGSPLIQTWLSPSARSLAASAIGFAFEAPTFTLTTQVAQQALGQSPDWSAKALTHSLASGALVLGGLKLGGAGAALLERQTAGRLTAFALPRSPFQQGGMLAGIYLGHGFEQAAGLRENRDGATTLLDSVMTLVQFNVAGRLTPKWLNQDLVRWETAAALGNRHQPGPRAADWVQTAALPALAGGSRSFDPKSELMVLSSSHDDQGRGAPPPSAPRDSKHSISSKPPSDQGVIAADALGWGTRQKRSSEDVTRMVKLIEQVRAEMWNALNLYVDKPLARALGQSKNLYVRIRPVDGSLDHYQIELSANPTPREVQIDYVELSFDANVGRLSLNDLPSQAVLQHRLKAQGLDQSRGFLGYYRSLGDFESNSLQSASMVAAMPANVRTLVLQQATHYLRQLPKMELLLPDLVPPSQPPPVQATYLTQYFPYVAEKARGEVDAFANSAGLQTEHRQRLQGLVQKLLVGLHARETADPKIIKYPYLIARMRPDPEVPRQRIIEVLSPNESMVKPPEKDEVLFNLVRNPGMTGDSFPYLHHIYIGANIQGQPTRAADLRFQKAVGLEANLKMRLDSLSTQTFDAAEAEQWMKANIENPG